MKISQKTVAEEAGVSRGTVDRVIHGKPSVSLKTQKRVLDVIKKLGYVPNEAGRALALSNRKYVICAALPDNPFFEDVRLGITAAERELADYNITVVRISTNGKDDNEIINLLTQCDYSAYMLAVTDTPQMCEFIRKKRQNDVPVITFNSDVKDSGRLCFVGQNLYQSGRIAASLMRKMLSGDVNRILIVTGSRKYMAHYQREKGFLDALSDSGQKFEIVSTIETEDDAMLTYSRVKKALEESGKIDGIYMASGHAESLANVIKDVGGKYRTVVNDLLPSIAIALRSGIFDFTILQSPFEQGYKPLRLLYDCLIRGKTPENEYYYTDNTILTEEMLYLYLTDQGNGQITHY